MRHLYSLPEEMFALRSLEQTDDIFKDFAILVCFVVLVIIDYCSFFADWTHSEWQLQMSD